MSKFPTIKRNRGDGGRLFEMARYERRAANVTPGALLKILDGVPHVYGADKRPEKLEWMIRQAKSITGK